ncbi:MAG: hypothetical protein RR315_00450 [Oscillospiraceae bacterium]
MTAAYTVIKKFSDNYYSVTQMKHRIPETFPIGFKRECKSYDDKLDESLVRSRTRIFELAICNPWEYFGTMTVNGNGYDRFDLNTFYSDFAKFINNVNFTYGLNIKYLLVPEMHKDGAWHMHGMYMNLPIYLMRLFTLKEYLPIKLRNRIVQGYEVFEWVSYSKKFGYNWFERIRNPEACCKYFTKYITKDIAKCVQACNANIYYCSQGLKRPTVIMEGDFNLMYKPDFDNVFISRCDYFDLIPALNCHKVQFYDDFISAGFDSSSIGKFFGGI